MLSQLLARQEELAKAEVPTVKQEPDKVSDLWGTVGWSATINFFCLDLSGFIWFSNL